MGGRRKCTKCGKEDDETTRKDWTAFGMLEGRIVCIGCIVGASKGLREGGYHEIGNTLTLRFKTSHARDVFTGGFIDGWGEDGPYDLDWDGTDVIDVIDVTVYDGDGDEVTTEAASRVRKP